MEPRGQFTFYRSYWEALADIPKKERLAIYEAVCAYALDGVEPELKGVARGVFSLVKPTLDAGRKKAANGKKGGESDRQTQSKTEASPKQAPAEKEPEKEKKKELETETECESRPPSPREEERQQFCRRVAALYHQLCPMLPRAEELTDSRRRGILALRDKLGYGEKEFETLFRRADASGFLCGGGEKGWRADLDWLLAPGNAGKVLGGRYDGPQDRWGGEESALDYARRVIAAKQEAQQSGRSVFDILARDGG